MAKRSKFPVVPALIGLGVFLWLKRTKNPAPSTTKDQIPPEKLDVQNELLAAASLTYNLLR